MRKVKEEIENVKNEEKEAEKRAELEQVAQIRYGKLRELEDKLQGLWTENMADLQKKGCFCERRGR